MIMHDMQEPISRVPANDLYNKTLGLQTRGYRFVKQHSISDEPLWIIQGIVKSLILGFPCGKLHVQTLERQSF